MSRELRVQFHSRAPHESSLSRQVARCATRQFVRAAHQNSSLYRRFAPGVLFMVAAHRREELAAHMSAELEVVSRSSLGPRVSPRFRVLPEPYGLAKF